MKSKFFDLAKELSYKSTHHQHRLGCVIVKKNRIIGLGFNKLKTHPKSKAPYNMIHAEIDALLGHDRAVLLGSEAYVYRETRDGVKALAKPCQGCHMALLEAGVKKIHFTIENGSDSLDLESEDL